MDDTGGSDIIGHNGHERLEGGTDESALQQAQPMDNDRLLANRRPSHLDDNQRKIFLAAVLCMMVSWKKQRQPRHQLICRRARRSCTQIKAVRQRSWRRRMRRLNETQLDYLLLSQEALYLQVQRFAYTTRFPPRQLPPPGLGRRSRTRTGWFETSFDGLSESEFCAQMRLPRARFHELVLELYDGVMERPDGSRVPYMSHRKRVSLALSKFARNSTMTALANEFQVSSSTASKVVREVAERLAGLKKRYISWPDEHERDCIKAAFTKPPSTRHIWHQRNWLCPPAIGAIDGTLLYLRFSPSEEDVLVLGPTGTLESYSTGGFGNKGYGFRLTAVVDHEYRIRYAFVGPARGHDSAHLKASALGQAMDQAPNERFRDEDFIIGDCAYAAGKHLFRPFRMAHRLTPIEAHWNDILCARRFLVENAFGILKQRWQILQSISVSLTAAYDVIDACMVLHNICVDERVKDHVSEEEFFLQYIPQDAARHPYDANDAHVAPGGSNYERQREVAEAYYNRNVEDMGLGHLYRQD